MISIVVIVKNEESRIKACLESVTWADEIIVIDNGSTDKTLDIVKQYTNKVLSVSDLDFASIRNQGMEKAKNDWVFFVDADERVLNDLKDEILEIIKLNQYSAVAISRRNIIFGQEKKYGPFWPDWVIRLLKKDEFEKWVGSIHEYPKFKGKLGYSKNSLLHLTHRNLDQVVLKSLEWSKIDAKLRFEASHPKMLGWRFLRILFSEIFYQGIIKRGFFGGTVGTIDSILQSFSMFMSYVRLWEMQNSKPLKEIYDDIDKKLLDNKFKL